MFRPRNEVQCQALTAVWTHLSQSLSRAGMTSRLPSDRPGRERPPLVRVIEGGVWNGARPLGCTHGAGSGAYEEAPVASARCN